MPIYADVTYVCDVKMTAPDPLQTVLDLLSNNWNTANTDSKKPKFIKITDAKRIDFNETSDFVIAQRPMNARNPAGIGPSYKHEKESFNLDIRVIGYDQEQHYLNVIEEVKRICQLKKVLPTSDYTVLEFDDAETDLSDKNYNLWRTIFPIQLYRYNVAR